jgi:hypothetical protein
MHVDSPNVSRWPFLNQDFHADLARPRVENATGSHARPIKTSGTVVAFDALKIAL